MTISCLSSYLGSQWLQARGDVRQSPEQLQGILSQKGIRNMGGPHMKHWEGDAGEKLGKGGEPHNQ